MGRNLHLAGALTGTPPSKPMPSTVRVVVADDHALMRRSLRELLQGEEGIEVISEAHDLGSAVSQVHGFQPHVLVLDLGITHGCGPETMVELRERAPSTQLVIVSMHESPGLAKQALGCGALGFQRTEPTASCQKQSVPPRAGSSMSARR